MTTTPRNEDRSSTSSDNSLGVTIGLREIYDKVADIAGRITQLTMQVMTLQTNQVSSTTEVDGIETRVRALEQRSVVTPAAMWTALGVITAVAGVIVAVIFGVLSS